MDGVVRILGIPGSLRKASFNRAALRAAQELLPPDAALDIVDLDGIPPFNDDDEQTPPARVVELKTQIREADAILIATPEYNYSVPGVLKNAIDWASRPYGDSAWDGKPVAIMGASVGATGTARAQYHLRQSFVFLNMHPLNRPEVMISNAAQRFDVNTRLVDPTSRKLVEQLLEELITWTRRLGKGGGEEVGNGNSTGPHHRAGEGQDGVGRVLRRDFRLEGQAGILRAGPSQR